jgi:hypothetical protein
MSSTYKACAMGPPKPFLDSGSHKCLYPSPPPPTRGTRWALDSARHLWHRGKVAKGLGATGYGESFSPGMIIRVVLDTDDGTLTYVYGVRTLGLSAASACYCLPYSSNRAIIVVPCCHPTPRTVPTSATSTCPVRGSRTCPRPPGVSPFTTWRSAPWPLPFPSITNATRCRFDLCLRPRCAGAAAEPHHRSRSLTILCPPLKAPVRRMSRESPPTVTSPLSASNRSLPPGGLPSRVKEPPGL